MTVAPLVALSFSAPVRDKAQMLARRQAALGALHVRQLELLGAWRRQESEALLTSLLLTVNAIAAGLGATG